MDAPRLTHLPHYKIALQVDPPHPQPYIIIETFATLNGPRTRICDDRFASIDEARAYLPKRRKSRAKPTALDPDLPIDPNYA